MAGWEEREAVVHNHGWWREREAVYLRDPQGAGEVGPAALDAAAGHLLHGRRPLVRAQPARGLGLPHAVEAAGALVAVPVPLRYALHAVAGLVHSHVAPVAQEDGVVVLAVLTVPLLFSGMRYDVVVCCQLASTFFNMVTLCLP